MWSNLKAAACFSRERLPQNRGLGRKPIPFSGRQDCMFLKGTLFMGHAQHLLTCNPGGDKTKTETPFTTKETHLCWSPDYSAGPPPANQGVSSQPKFLLSFLPFELGLTKQACWSGAHRSCLPLTEVKGVWTMPGQTYFLTLTHNF